MHATFLDKTPFHRSMVHNSMRHLSFLIGIALALILGPSASGALAQNRPLIEEGRYIVSSNCARCHAIEKSGASPFPDAPPFRTLSAKYPIEHLAEALAEGIMSGHPAMPEFIFSPNQIDAILAYLESLADQR